MVQHLLKTKGHDYILTGNIQSDPLEKSFGRYRQLSGTNYFGSEKQFFDAEKSIRVKPLIKYSGYTMKEVSSMMVNYNVEAQEMLLPQPDHAHMTQMDLDIVYYVAGFISKSVKKAVTCVACGDILAEKATLEINFEGYDPRKLSVLC